VYAKVSKKGQVTIPRLIRGKLNLGEKSAVLFIIENGEVKLKGIPAGSSSSLSGSLKENAHTYDPLEKVRERIQESIARDTNSEHE